jgi:hypothetical protein
MPFFCKEKKVTRLAALLQTVENEPVKQARLALSNVYCTIWPHNRPQPQQLASLTLGTITTRHCSACDPMNVIARNLVALFSFCCT